MKTAGASAAGATSKSRLDVGRFVPIGVWRNGGFVPIRVISVSEYWSATEASVLFVE